MAVVRAVRQTGDEQDRLSTRRSFFHQYAVTALASALHQWSLDYSQGVAVASPRVIFASGDEVIPDVVWMSRQRLRDRGLDRDGNLRQPPELIAEVLTPGPRNIWHDRESKRQVYERSGVQEYWIVDGEHQMVDVYRVESSPWSSHTGALTIIDQIDRAHAISSPLLPLFSLKVSVLFPTLVPRT